MLRTLSRDVFRAILDARVVGSGDAERKPQFEVFEVAFLADQEGVAVGFVFVGRLAVKDTVFDGPQAGIAVPAGEILAVEEALHVVRFGRRTLGIGGHCGEGEGKEGEEGQGANHVVLRVEGGLWSSIHYWLVGRWSQEL